MRKLGTLSSLFLASLLVSCALAEMERKKHEKAFRQGKFLFPEEDKAHGKRHVTKEEEPDDGTEMAEESNRRNSTKNGTEHSGDLLGDRHGLGIGQNKHHHGVMESNHGHVKLISWRWSEFRNTILFTVMILVACLLKVGFHHVPSLAHHFPESCLLIIVGLITGVIVHFAYEIDDKDSDTYFPSFTSDLFFNILLPPIILDAAYSIYDEDFFLNLNAILVFAVVGTVFNILAVGGLLYVILSTGVMGAMYGTSFVQFLVFTSVISAVDPVAVLAIFEEIGVNMVLYFLVFGESLLNDGVSVVVYNTMITLSSQEHIGADQYVLAVLSFFTVVLGGILVGSVVGVLTSLVLRLTSRARVLEPLIIIILAYLAYIFAELVHWSGIISLVACGIFQKRYAFINASKKSYTTVKYGVKTLSATSDCIIFIFLGKVAANRFPDLIFNWSFIVSTILIITVVRFLGVFLLCLVVNSRRTTPISFREQFIMAYGGLRGAVGFSLIYILFDEDPSPTNRVFLTTTLVVVFFTVFVQGGTIKPLVNCLKIARKEERDRSKIISDVNRKTVEHLMAGVESVAGRLTIGSVYSMIETFDNMYVKKFLLSRKSRDRLTLRLEKITLDEHYARLYGPAVLAARREARWAVEPDLAALLGSTNNASSVEKEEEDGEAAVAAMFTAKAAEGEGGGGGGEDDVAVRIKKRDASVESFRRSLNAGFSSSAYERYRIKTKAEGGSGNVFWADSALIQQLQNKSRQARKIERRLLLSAGAEVAAIPEEEGEMMEEGEDDVMMRPRARSSLSASQLRSQYMQAKKRFKSIQDR